MNSACSKGYRAWTTRGVTLLSLIASTMSFASVVYVGPQTARESLGIDGIGYVTPGPQGRDAALAPSDRMDPAISLASIGGMAVGLPVDEAANASRMAPLVASLGDQASDAMNVVHRDVEPMLRHCSRIVLSRGMSDADDVLHPVSRFLAPVLDVDGVLHALSLDASMDASADHEGSVACTLPDQGEKPRFASADGLPRILPPSAQRL